MTYVMVNILLFINFCVIEINFYLFTRDIFFNVLLNLVSVFFSSFEFLIIFFLGSFLLDFKVWVMMEF